MLRPLRLLAAIALFGAAEIVRAAGVEFIRVWPQWRADADFMRISEYFTGKENSGSRITVRTHPAVRAGYYFLARVSHPGVGLAGARFVVHVITPADPVAREFTFPIDCPPGTHVFDLGLTGVDWASRNVHPVAWMLELRDKDGHTLATQQSFLWAKPGQ